eukprot:Nitzschia sp. Nitz4//scaffold30_size153850//112537//115408//NITZ4_002790-RA/size153850-processed-gene-0.50-mRNA-1//-1//CDS//3329547300//8128//frame0
MVMTRLSQMAGQGWGWYSGSGTGTGSTTPSAASMGGAVNTGSSAATGNIGAEAMATSSHNSNIPGNLPETATSQAGYWETAQGSLQSAADYTYSTLAGWVPSLPFSASLPFSDTMSDSSSMGDHHHTSSPMIMDTMGFSRRPPQSLLSNPALLGLFSNPYVAIRGGGRKYEGHAPASSMAAIRSFLSVVPAAGSHFSDVASDASSTLQTEQPNSPSSALPASDRRPSIPYTTSDRNFHYGTTAGASGTSTAGGSAPGLPPAMGAPISSSTSAETASHLAEGTIRAFRDIALDEAVDLHQALRYWSYRWERPVLAWLEAGPTVWFSREGYQHQQIGQKVSQIQAVLARRCATIGELQQHLLRAGWQRGVAQWGVLGDGGEWATVAGGDGRMDDYMDIMMEPRSSTTSTTMAYGAMGRPPPPQPPVRQLSGEVMEHIQQPPELPRKAPSSNVSQLAQRSKHNELYYTSVLVKHNNDGNIVIDDPALAAWSVDAMALIRRQLFRAANGMIPLPYASNWAEGEGYSRFSHDAIHGSMSMLEEPVISAEQRASRRSLPLWASVQLNPLPEVSDDATSDTSKEDAPRPIQITDVPLLVQEVSELLDVMESVMTIQRARRLEKLKPQWWLRRNWYVSLALPPLVYGLYKAKGFGLEFLRYAAKTLTAFFNEHVVDPMLAMYDEFTKGPENISDREAREVAIKNLKVMIRSWLDETHPEMSVQARKRMAKNMDISLIEAEKAESMKTIYNINSVIRMSFIEAQFLKKEMMNALLAMDEMRAATNFNMNLAAVTPFVLLVWATQRAFKFVFYAMLKMGKSREETYGSFLHTLTEMERLLIMRDNPPVLSNSKDPWSRENSVLSADDLGMLMLHIHELRTILWQDQRRFTPNILRSVAEDLAELAGERGAVSVRQQLLIISRMCRTYPFLKAVNTRMLEYRY